MEAIRALPGENYLMDMEQALFDVTVHYKFAKDWTAYGTFGLVSFNGGFMDSTIEEFHDTFGFSTFGRPAVARNDMNVYFTGTRAPVRQDSQVIPTLILGYEFKLTPHTNVNLQTYASKSVYSNTTTGLEELTATKYQYSLGVRHRIRNVVITVAFNENLQNVNNTPDVGFQLGVAYAPF